MLIPTLIPVTGYIPINTKLVNSTNFYNISLRKMMTVMKFINKTFKIIYKPQVYYNILYCCTYGLYNPSFVYSKTLLQTRMLESFQNEPRQVNFMKTRLFCHGSPTMQLSSIQVRPFYCYVCSFPELCLCFLWFTFLKLSRCLARG